MQAQPQAIATDLLSALSVDQVFDAMAIRLDGPRAAADGLASVIDWHITDLDVHHRVTVRNGVVVPEPLAGPPDDGAADARYALTRAELLPVLVGLTTVDPVEGDPAAPGRPPGPPRPLRPRLLDGDAVKSGTIPP